MRGTSYGPWHTNPRGHITELEKERHYERLVVEGATDLFSTLTPEQRSGVRDFILQRCGAKKQSVDANLSSALYVDDFDYPPVPPRVYFTHADYMGHIAPQIYPTWWPHLLHMTDPLNKYSEVILTGAIGIGKSTLAMMLLSYKLYRLSCLRDPAIYYGLSKNSKIVFGLYSITLEHAESTGFYTLRDQMLGESPYFVERFPRVQAPQEYIRFNKAIEVITGSGVLHTLGRNLFSLGIDELNFMKRGKEGQNKPMELANAVTRRLESRFRQSSGDMPGVCVFISSKRATGDFIENRVKSVRHLPNVYIVDGPIWEFKPTDYSGLKFRVSLGTTGVDAMLLDEVEFDELGKAVRTVPVDSGTREGEVIEVPVEFFHSFKTELMGALRDIAGVSTDAINPLFKQKSTLNAMFDPTLVSPFDAETMPLHTGAENLLEDVFQAKRVSHVRLSSYAPLRHPGVPRYIHVDLALRNDRAGIVMVHPSEHYREKREQPDPETKLPRYNTVSNVEVDFVIAVTSSMDKTHQIDLAKIRKFIMWLRSLGFWIKLVTFDSFNSADSIQRLSENKIPSELLSVDKTPHPYLTLRQVISEGRLKAPRHNLLLSEMTSLEYDIVNKKIDHPKDGSKDCADALCGAVYSCVTDERALVDKDSPKSAPSVARSRENDRLAAKLSALNKKG